MTWREAIDIVLEKEAEKWPRQEDLAGFLGVHPSTLSKMGKGWELHWQCFLKLLPYFTRHDVLTEPDLHGGKSHEPPTNQGGDKKVKTKTGSNVR